MFGVKTPRRRVWKKIVCRFKKAHKDWREWCFIEDTFGYADMRIMTVADLADKYTRSEKEHKFAMDNLDWFVWVSHKDEPAEEELELYNEDFRQYYEVYDNIRKLD